MVEQRKWKIEQVKNKSARTVRKYKGVSGKPRHDNRLVDDKEAKFGSTVMGLHQSVGFNHTVLSDITPPNPFAILSQLQKPTLLDIDDNDIKKVM